MSTGKADRIQGAVGFQNGPVCVPQRAVQKVREGLCPLVNTTYTPRLSSVDTAVDLDRKDVKGVCEISPWALHAVSLVYFPHYRRPRALRVHRGGSNRAGWFKT